MRSFLKRMVQNLLLLHLAHDLQRPLYDLQRPLHDLQHLAHDFVRAHQAISIPLHPLTDIYIIDLPAVTLIQQSNHCLLALTPGQVLLLVLDGIENQVLAI